MKLRAKDFRGDVAYRAESAKDREILVFQNHDSHVSNRG
jgi:hypothetical protein